MAEPILTQSRAAALRLSGTEVRLTAQPEAAVEQLLNTSITWLGLMAYWALADALIAIFPPGGRQMPPDGWLTHLILTLVGLGVVWCMHRTGFPVAWDARTPASRRLLLPTLVGIGFGLLAIGMELYTGTLKNLEATTGPVTVAFPGSLLTYSAGAITMEMLFLLLPLPPLLWLVSVVILRGRGQVPTFWVLAVLSAAAEPLLQGTTVVMAAEGTIGPLAIGLYAVHGFAFNFTAVALFRRYGLLAPILVRLGHYMIWHVLYGNFFL
jgi:hypothetical protein